MAQRVITQLVSDLTGDEIPAGEGKSINFSVDGVDYTIDLSDKEAEKFYKAIGMYLDNAQKVGGRARRSTATGGKRDASETKAIKQWADEQGIDYPSRGRLPQELINQYHSAKGKSE